MKKWIMLAMALGLLFCGRANAGEAWILWEQGYSLSGEDSIRWHIIGAYPSHVACLKEEIAICMRRQQLAIEDKYWEDIKCYPSWGGHTLSLSKGHGNPPDFKNRESEWKCLPDTIDPRK